MTSRFTVSLLLCLPLAASVCTVARAQWTTPFPATAEATAPATPAAATATPTAPANPVFNYTREDLVRDLAAQLGEHYRSSGDLQIELIRPWNQPAPGEEPAKLVLLEAPSTLTSTLLVRFRLQSGAQILGESTMMVRAQLMRDVWVTRTPVERGTVFDPSQMDVRRVDTLREREALCASDSAGELTLLRSIPAGRMLSWRDVARRALVRKGEVIEVAAVDGALSVSMKALAMENGSAGEMVRVRNLESKKEFTAQVVSENRAQVRF
jgi:flagellar basal body P-ring formation protein FlgA